MFIMHDKTFAVLDTETTGFSAERWDKLIEIAAIKIRNLKLKHTETFETLLDPKRTIPPSASRVNWITYDMLVWKPLIEDKIDELIEFLSDVDYTVIHNASFDLGFLNYELNRLWKNFVIPYPICSVELSKNLYPDFKSHNLDAIARRFNLNIHSWENRHRALWDVILTWEAFLKFYEENPMMFILEVDAISKKYHWRFK